MHWDNQALYWKTAGNKVGEIKKDKGFYTKCQIYLWETAMNKPAFKFFADLHVFFFNF